MVWQVGLTILIMYASSQLAVQIPGLAVPVTFQSMFIVLLPLLLKSRYASLGILGWLLIGSFGLPVFSNHSGGHMVFFSNSGGYLLGFYLIATLTERLKKFIAINALTIFLAFIVMHVLLVVIGLLWIWSGSYSEIYWSTHILPYIPGMIVKCLLGASLFIYLRRLTKDD